MIALHLGSEGGEPCMLPSAGLPFLWVCLSCCAWGHRLPAAVGCCISMQKYSDVG